MGRKSREKRERRVRRSQQSLAGGVVNTANRSERVSQLEAELDRLADGETSFWHNDQCTDEVRQSHLEDVLAFESLKSGPSLFQGLQANGVDLPPPGQLSEAQCADKVCEILGALAGIYVFVTGFEHLSPRQAYTLLWQKTLWEGCYVKKRTPGGITVIDASHRLSRSDLQNFVEELFGPQRVN